jgi:hypothetical protein
MRLYGVKGAELQWIQDRLGLDLTPKAKGIAAVDAFGRTRGMVAYDDWTLGSCKVHICLESSLCLRYLLPDIFSYPFAHIQVLIGVTPGDNRRSLDLSRALGFEQRYAIENGHSPGVPLVISEMQRHHCRYLASRAESTPPPPPHLEPEASRVHQECASSA